MKKFVVSKDCNACGECVVLTDLLTEDPLGFAMPMEDRYIRDSELEDAKRIVDICPVRALSIIEQNHVQTKDRESLNGLPKALEEKMLQVEIPEIPYSDVRYDDKEITIEHGWAKGENNPIYSSARQAKNAAIEEFNQVYWNRRKDFALNALMQYKSKKLRPYYDFSNPEKTYYSKIDESYETILKEFKAETEYLTNDRIKLPEDFTCFHPELDSDFKKLANDNLDLITATYINSFFDGFEKDSFYRKSEIEKRIYTNENVKIIGTDWLGNNKIKTTYDYSDVNEQGQWFVDAIVRELGCPGDNISVRSLDDVAHGSLPFVINQYRKLVNKEIKKKVAELKASLEKC